MKEGWEYKNLGDIGTFVRGGNFSKKDFVDNGFPCIHYGQIHMKFGIETFKHISSVPAEIVKPDRCAHKGDLVIAITSEDDAGSCKCTAWMGDYDVYVGGHTAIYRHTMQPKYVSYYFLSPDFQKDKLEFTHGFKVVEISPKDIAKIAIPVPPLSEQQSIVDYLDSAFAKIDAMKANAEKALNEAKALFQASLKEMLEPKEGWSEFRLSEVVNVINGYAFPSKAFGDNQDLKVIKITNVGVGLFIEDESTLPKTMFVQDACVKEGDIVIALTRTIISEGLKRAKVPSNYNGAMLNQRVASLRYNGNINMSFLYYYLGSSFVSDYVWSHVNTLMQPNLSIKDLKDLPVNMPNLSEQQSIVNTLDSLKSKVDKLQENYNNISQECDALKQAILRQVFE